VTGADDTETDCLGGVSPPSPKGRAEKRTKEQKGEQKNVQDPFKNKSYGEASLCEQHINYLYSSSVH